MSAYTRKQTCAVQLGMSALGQKRTCAAHLAMSAKGQKQTSGRLFDHLVGANKQSVWHSQPKDLGSLQVDDQLNFGRLHHR